MHQDQPHNLDAYIDLGADDVARLVLCLLIEEMLRDRLSAYRDVAGPLTDGIEGGLISVASEQVISNGPILTR